MCENDDFTNNKDEYKECCCLDRYINLVSMDSTAEQSISTDEQSKRTSPGQSISADTDISQNNSGAMDIDGNTTINKINDQSVIEILSDDEEKSTHESSQASSSAAMDKYEPMDIDEILGTIHSGNTGEQGNDEPTNVLDDFIDECASELQPTTVADIQNDGKLFDLQNRLMTLFAKKNYLLSELIDLKADESILLNEPSCSGLSTGKIQESINQTDEILLLDSSSELDSTETEEKHPAKMSDGDDVVFIDDDTDVDDQLSGIDSETNTPATEYFSVTSEQPAVNDEAAEFIDVFDFINENEALFTNADGGILLPQSGYMPTDCDKASVKNNINDDRPPVGAGGEDVNEADAGAGAGIDDEIAAAFVPAEKDNEEEILPDVSVNAAEFVPAEAVNAAESSSTEDGGKAAEFKKPEDLPMMVTIEKKDLGELAKSADEPTTSEAVTDPLTSEEMTPDVASTDEAVIQDVITEDNEAMENAQAAVKPGVENVTIEDDVVSESITTEDETGTENASTENDSVTNNITTEDESHKRTTTNEDNAITGIVAIERDAIAESVTSSHTLAIAETESVEGEALIADTTDVTMEEISSNNEQTEANQSHEKGAESVEEGEHSADIAAEDDIGMGTLETDPQPCEEPEKIAQDIPGAVEQIIDEPSVSEAMADKSNEVENAVTTGETTEKSKNVEETEKISNADGSGDAATSTFPIIDIDSDGENDNDTRDLACAETITEEEEEEMSEESLALSHKECINVECTKRSTSFLEAPELAFNHYRLTKRMKYMHICEDCYNQVLDSYGILCAALEDKQPLFEHHTYKQSSVEVLDSSDDEDDAPNKKRPKHTFDSQTLTLIENELEDIISDTFKRIDITQQMNGNRQILNKRIQQNKEISEQLSKSMADLKKKANTIYYDTYRNRSNFIEHCPSLDLNTGRQTKMYNDTYPPVGEVVYPEWKPNRMCYSYRKKQTGAWIAWKVVKVEKTIDDESRYTIQFTSPKKEPVYKNNVSGKQIAYGRAPEVRLSVGQRVIALATETDEKQSTKRLMFYPGTVAEPLSKYNQYRYLVFFDDGYVQYVEHDLVRLICKSEPCVWDSIENRSTRLFIKDYLDNYKRKRAFVNARMGQRLQIETENKWQTSVVTQIDASLIKVFYEDLRRTEWIYRGSTRIFTLFKQIKKLPTQNRAGCVEYIEFIDNKEPTQTTEPPPEPEPQPQPKPASNTDQSHQRTFASQANRETSTQQKRSVAKKSSAAPQKQPAVLNMNNSTIYVDEDKPKGKVVYYTAKKQQYVKEFQPHECSPQCLPATTHNLKAYSPLSKPLLSGWERQLNKTKTNKKCVSYRAPCGRRLREMTELHKFLRVTQCALNVDNFDFDPLVYCLAEYVIDSYVYKKSDISEGIEGMHVQYINCYDKTTPPPCKYSSTRIPNEGVPLNLDPEFLCGCDCEDDCSDKEKCQCWQMTLAGAKFLANQETPIEKLGYEYKRLNEPIQTGIYECNSRCKCKSSCLNRVAQQPLQIKLQVFKTMNRGWGIRCLNDIPKGE